MSRLRVRMVILSFFVTTMAYSQFMGISDYSKGWKEVSENMKHGMESGFTPQEATKKSITSGRSLYKANCQICHGLEGKGDGPFAKTLKKKPSDLVLLARRYPRHRFFMRISYGKGAMPAWRDQFSTEELWHITNYVKSLDREQDSPGMN